MSFVLKCFYTGSVLGLGLGLGMGWVLGLGIGLGYEKFRARCGLGFVCFYSSALELKIFPCGKKQVHQIEFPTITHLTAIYLLSDRRRRI